MNEYPQVIFTLRSILEELTGEVDFELIAVNNYTEETKRVEDKGGSYVEGFAKNIPELNYLRYPGKLSHWQAKNYAISQSSGKFLWFCDSHCIPGRGAVIEALNYYRNNHELLNGSLHLPLTYHILESKKLIYKLNVNRPTGSVHYSFSSYIDKPLPYEVPCMSTCGMMISRKLFDEIKAWPHTLGIYGGGENYINFVMAVMGKKKWIMPGKPLHHHGEKRGYAWNHDDHVRNRMIAIYCAGGEKWLALFTAASKGSETVLKNYAVLVVNQYKELRRYVKEREVFTLDKWLQTWGC